MLETTQNPTQNRVQSVFQSPGQTIAQPTPASPTESATLPAKPVGKIHPSNADALNVVMRGRIGNHIEYTVFPSGIHSAKFRLAVGRKGRDDAGQWHDMGVTWYTVRLWGKLAEHASRSLRKGEPVVVSGRLEVNQWVSESSGQKGMELIVVANTVGHDLNFGVSYYTKLQQPEAHASEPTVVTGSFASGTVTHSPAEDEEDAAAEETGPGGEDPINDVTALSSVNELLGIDEETSALVG